MDEFDIAWDSQGTAQEADEFDAAWDNTTTLPSSAPINNNSSINNSMFSFNTLKNAPKSLVKGVRSLADMAAVMDPHTLMTGAVGGASSLMRGDSIADAWSNAKSEGSKSFPMQGTRELDNMRTEYLGEPEYDSRGGQYVGKALEMLPTAVIPGGGGLAARAGTALLSGAGGQAALDLGAPEVVGNLMGAGLPALTRGGLKAAGNFLGPQTEARASSTAAAKLSEYIDDKLFSKAIKDAEQVPLGSQKSSAELARSPEFAIMEQQLGSGEKALEYGALKEAREGARNAVIAQALPGVGAPREVAGSELLAVLNRAKSAEKAEVKALYENIPMGTAAPITQLQMDAREYAKKYYGSSAVKVPAGIQKHIAYITSPRRNKQMSIGQLQSTRSHLGDVARAKPGSQEAALATEIRDALARTIDDAPAGAVEWRTANKAYADYAGKFKSGPLAKIDQGLASNSIDRVTSSPEAATQFMRMVKRSPKAVTAIQQQLAKEFAGMTRAQQKSFILNKSSELKILLGEKSSSLEALAGDIVSKDKLYGLANATGGPNTALKLSGAVERAITGKQKETALSGVGGKLMNFLTAGGAIGAAAAAPAVAIPALAGAYGVGALRGRSTKLVRDALYKQLTNPKQLEAAIKTFKNAPKSTALASGTPPAIMSVFKSAQDDKDKENSSMSTVFKSAQDDKDKENSSMSTVFSKPESGKTNKKLEVKAIEEQIDAESGKMNKKLEVKAIEEQIDADPYLSALYEAESGRNPSAKNPESSAKGGFQFIDRTAKALGLDDPMDLGQSLKAISKLTDEHKGRFGEDPLLLYSAHYLGSRVLRKLLDKQPLSEKEQAQVAYLEEKALPRFQRIYESRKG